MWMKYVSMEIPVICAETSCYKIKSVQTQPSPILNVAVLDSTFPGGKWQINYFLCFSCMFIFIIIFVVALVCTQWPQRNCHWSCFGDIAYRLPCGMDHDDSTLAFMEISTAWELVHVNYYTTVFQCESMAQFGCWWWPQGCDWIGVTVVQNFPTWFVKRLQACPDLLSNHIW